MGILLNTAEFGRYIANSHTITYLPKLAVLQIGAIIYASGGIHAHLAKGNDKDSIEDAARSIRREASKYLPVANVTDSYSYHIFNYIATLSKLAKHQYEKYYIDWIVANKNYAAKLCDKNSDCYLPTYEENGTTVSNRKVLNQNNEIVQKLTNDLLKAVCVVRLSVNHHNSQKRESYALSEGTAKSYLKGFMDRLQELYHINSFEDENGNIVRTTDEPNKTTPDMKKELYRYMKQIYDKWIPMSSFDDWKLESFFVTEGDELGHKFYFFDSYYNDISNKLLINPKTIAEKIEALLKFEDINSMLLGFISDMYSASKSMLMTIQNFADLRQPKAMDEMFTPISYNSIKWSGINKYPSFVVVYPYQASKNLNIPNGEYTNDGFMLNDEFETPMAIRSKTNEENGHFRIPAFGVSYGKQYQSYFKKVNINMKSPIATEQSIRAKHAILIGATSNGEKGIKSQDLYDVYASQSYTCDVEMMGCAWVQPLMYFVLLNVPMFRGSYLIMKVKHSIRPGVMTTNFTGCRMANVSNTLVEDIFTDGDTDATNGEYSSFETDRQLLANIDNDCPYKVYPLWGANENADIVKIIKEAEGGYAGNIDGKICTMRGVTLETYREHFGATKTCNDLRNISDSEWWMIFKKSFWDRWQADNIRNTSIANLVVDWTWASGKWGIYCPEEVLGVPRSLTKDGIASAVDAINRNTNQSELFQKLWNRRKEYFESIATGDKKKFLKGWLNRLNRFSYSENTPSTTTDKKEEDVNTAFFNAINRSAQDTPSISTELHKIEVDKLGYLKIKQKNGKTDKLAIVFDMILNSEYYNYVQELGWVYPNGGMQTSVNPDVIYCKLTQKPENNVNKIVWAVQYGNSITNRNTEIPTSEGSSNDLILKSLAKRRAAVGNDTNFKKEVPQLKDLSGLDKYKPQDCNSLVSTASRANGNGQFVSGNYKPSRNRQRLVTELGFSSQNPSKSECDSKMVTITVETTNGGKKLTVHRNVVEEVQAIFRDIKRFNPSFIIRNEDTAAYCYRNIAGTSKLSLHSFGIAIDINWGDNPMLRGHKPLSNGDDNIRIRTLNSPVVKAFEAHGWGWGGTYGDYMHFSKFGGS